MESAEYLEIKQQFTYELALQWITGGFLLFHLLNVVVDYCEPPVTVRQDGTLTGMFRSFRWRNLVVSWLHACMTGTWAMCCSIYDWRAISQDPFLYASWPGIGVACFSTGYFLYDTVDILRSTYIRAKLEILIHHVAIIAIALYPLTTLHGMGYHVISMCIEFNTAFLHARKILLMAGFSSRNLFVRCIMLLNLATFLACRMTTMLYLLAGIYWYWFRVPLWFLITFSVGMIVLLIISSILFYRLLAVDFLPSLRKHHSDWSGQTIRIADDKKGEKTVKFNEIVEAQTEEVADTGESNNNDENAVNANIIRL